MQARGTQLPAGPCPPTREEAQRGGAVDDLISVALRAGPHHVQVVGHKVRRVVARRAKVDQVDLPGGGVKQEVAPAQGWLAGAGTTHRSAGSTMLSGTLGDAEEVGAVKGQREP